MTISNFVAYVKQAWKNKPDTSTPLSAARLTHLEDGIKGNSDAIEKIAAAVVSQIVNDPNKIASMASLYSVNQAVTQLNSDSVKKRQSQSINPDTIKWTDVRSLNGWDGSIQPHIPVKLHNQWLSCVTTSPYDGANSEALCQILISADKAVHASRRMDNNGNWLPWQVSDLDKRLNAITITSGTLLDAIKNMGDNVHNLFVAAPYFPPDIPLQAAEFAIEIIKENDTSRIMVIAHRYGGELSSFYRTLFNGQWNSGWVQK
nr:MAG TPA: hypothetical protein [Caudoviricetes sp.]